jgi:aerobic-type carbon monoxide dehydrogenase small subunit (CoxS/CutS family)
LKAGHKKLDIEQKPNMTTTEARAIEINVNGRPCQVAAAPDTSLLMALRQDLDLKGTRVGCTEGHCGACTVLIDGRPTQSCTTPLWSVVGTRIRTIEGLSDGGVLASVQQAFVDEQAAQCGYCTNGIIMTVTAMLAQSPSATRTAIVATLDERHLCRCGAQPRILRAIDRAIAQVGGRG